MRDIAWPDDIQAVLTQLDGLLTHASQASSTLGQRLNYQCRTGCGKCCTTPDVEAMPIEMLRMAAHILERGDEEMWWRKIEAEGLPCPVYAPVSKDQPEMGSCMLYADRPSVCRLFGFAFSPNKTSARLALCRILKSDYPHLEFVEPVNVPPAESENATSPVSVTDYQSQLASLSVGTLSKEVPIGEALSLALHYLMNRIIYQLEPFALSVSATPPRETERQHQTDDQTI